MSTPRKATPGARDARAAASGRPGMPKARKAPADAGAVPPETVEAAPAEVVEPAPAAGDAAAPRKTVEAVPAEAVEPAPAEVVEPVPAEVVEPVLAEVVEPAPAAGDAAAPGKTAEAVPAEVVEAVPAEVVEPVPAGDAAAAGKPAAGKAARPAGSGGGGVRPAGASRPATPALPPGPGLVVGPVPVLARVAGAVALAAAAVLLVAPAFPLARSRGQDLGGAGNLAGFLPSLPLVAVVAAAGVLAVRGRLPRLGLAALLPAGTLAAGLLLRTLALLDADARGTLDLPLGIGTSARYDPAAGLQLSAAGYALLVAAALLAAAAWPRTLMEDAGSLDPRRPRLAAWGLAAGVLAALVLGMAPYSSTVAPGTPTLPERSGPDLLGALVLALGAMAWAVLAATLRPRLAVVGAYAGLAAVLLSEGLASALLVARSPVVGLSAGGVGTLLAALAVALLGWVAAGRRGPRRSAP